MSGHTNAMRGISLQPVALLLFILNEDKKIG